MWVVDRIEGDMAVISADDREETFDVPLSVLPPGVNEGDTISLAVGLADDTERLSGVTDQLKALAEDDDGGDFSL